MLPATAASPARSLVSNALRRLGGRQPSLSHARHMHQQQSAVSPGLATAASTPTKVGASATPTEKKSRHAGLLACPDGIPIHDYIASPRFSLEDKVKLTNTIYQRFIEFRGGFDVYFKDVEIVDVSTGRVTAKLTVPHSLTNAYGTLHGGAQATLVDLLGTMAIVTKDCTKLGVSVEIATSYITAAPQGETITIEAEVLRISKNVGFSDVKLYAANGTLVSSGKHNKFFSL